MKTYILKLVSAVAIQGAIARAGSLVGVSEVEAKNLLARGKAVLATAADGDHGDADSDAGDDDSSGAEKPRKKKTREGE